MYDEVETFCHFMGYTRSGHSLVGTILDAHPEAVVAHEHPVLATGRDGLGRLAYTDREAMFDALMGTVQKHRRKGRRGYRRTQPNRLIEGAGNGAFTRLRMIGTTLGQETPLAWDANPALFEDLAGLAGSPVRLVHVYRNPWDNISSMTRVVAIDRAIRKYFIRAEVIKRFKSESATPLLDVALEDLTADPRGQIRGLAAFYGLDAPDDWVEACAAVVDPTAQASRRERDWTGEEIERIAAAKRSIPWLARFPDSPAD